MGKAIITMKIMPDSPETDLEALEVAVKKKIVEFAGEGETKTIIEPVAFGLKSLNITFVMDEAKGSTEKLENNINSLEAVNSVNVTDVRRALG